MKNIDKKQLKIMSMEFRTIANRLITCNQQTGMPLLKKFLGFIDENEIISEYVQEHVRIEDFEPIERGTAFYSMGDTKQEEISYTYQYLKHAAGNFHNFYYDIASNYASDAKDSVKEFCNRIILPFVNYIEGYLTEIGIRMGYDEDVKFVINLNGGVAQVNVANDNSTLNATQNNGIDAIQLESLISKVLESITDDLSPQEKELITDNIEVIREETKSSSPRKGFINTALKGLRVINGTAQFGAAVVALIEFISKAL
ncbi:hypothetical protein GXP70_00505 [Paenibacillus lycopersici]|uniref:AbiTii domain-containing protein n=1 Tax=Paenibacillus lycopersici TaxID=2704462 RepID=A0A6C0FND2_9BACL|nr:hypothetical protein [Paenibacillus lycopersici]QHT58608.1 hypothetical protein GXP70_00505 [Paenibacillus lycopersici]